MPTSPATPAPAPTAAPAVEGVADRREGARPGLVVVDVQNDFCEGGSLAVPAGAAVAARVADLLGRHRSDYALVVFTRDWHTDPGGHFADEPDYATTWPVHCVAGTTGADLHPALAEVVERGVVVSKGAHEAAYSGFQGTTEGGTPLATLLRAAGVERLDVCGIATDHCVRATVLDARAEGFGVRVLLDGCAGVAPATTAAALAEMAAAGAELVEATAEAAAPAAAR